MWPCRHHVATARDFEAGCEPADRGGCVFLLRHGGVHLRHNRHGSLLLKTSQGGAGRSCVAGWRHRHRAIAARLGGHARAVYLDALHGVGPGHVA